MAASLNNLADLYSMQGMHSRAEPFLVHTLAIVERGLGPHHPWMSALHRLYGLILREMGREAIADQNPSV